MMGVDVQENIELAGKMVVYYRKIYNRPIEILAQSYLPMDEPRALEMMYNLVLKEEEHLQRFQEKLPEYIDLKAQKYTDENGEKLLSFKVYIGLYDYKRGVLDVPLFGLTHPLRRELRLGSVFEKELRDLLSETYGWMKSF